MSDDGRLVRLSGRQPLVSEGFRQWLADESASVLFVSDGRLWVVGTALDGTVDVVDRGFAHGLTAVAVHSDTVVLAGWQVWTYRDAGGSSDVSGAYDGHDRLYLPQSAVTVGDIGICDIGIWDRGGGPGGLVLASSRLGCLAELDPRWSFRPVWMPPWQDGLEDHGPGYLGGMGGGENGAPVWVAFSISPDRRAGGLILDTGGTVLRSGLSRPRAPRAHRDRVYVANAGTGELLALNPDAGEVEVIAAWPAACRALAVHGRWAVVGLSSAAGPEYTDLPVARAGDGPDGLAVVDLDGGQIAGTLTLQGRSRGVSSVAVIPGCRWPEIAVPRGPTARETVTVGPADPIVTTR